jgi:hypothetical protein
MTASEWTEFREIVDRCLAGVEQSSAIVARFGELKALHYEANYQASRRGEPPLPEYPVEGQLSAVERRRFLALTEAVIRDSTSALEWLPLDSEGTA